MQRQNLINILIVLAVFGTVGCVSAWRNAKGDPPPFEVSTNENLPQVLEIGAGKCVDCQKMAPLIEELRREYEGKAIFKSIDVMECS